MKMTGIIYTGDTKTVNTLYQRYCDRLEQDMDVSIIGSNNTYLGRITGVKMNPENTILYATMDLNLEKHKYKEWKYVESNLKDENFIRRFPIPEVK